MSEILQHEWAVGFHDRGHGHGDYAVIVKGSDIPEPNWDDEKAARKYIDEAIRPPTVVVKCPDPETAEYLVSLHNERLQAAGIKVKEPTT